MSEATRETMLHDPVLEVLPQLLAEGRTEEVLAAFQALVSRNETLERQLAAMLSVIAGIRGSPCASDNAPSPRGVIGADLDDSAFGHGQTSPSSSKRTRNLALDRLRNSFRPPSQVTEVGAPTSWQTNRAPTSQETR